MENNRSKHERDPRRSGDNILPWIRANMGWLVPGAIVAGVAVGTWFKTDFATSVINPQSMLTFREKTVRLECRAGIDHCFTNPNLSVDQLWNCLDKVAKPRGD